MFEIDQVGFMAPEERSIEHSFKLTYWFDEAHQVGRPDGTGITLMICIWEMYP